MIKKIPLADKPIVPADSLSPNASMVVIDGDKKVKRVGSADLTAKATAGLASESDVTETAQNLAALQSQFAALQAQQSRIDADMAALGQRIDAIQLTPGPKGDSATPAQIAAATASYLQAHPPPSGANGKDGAAPTDGQIAAAAAQYIAAHPPQNGVDGKAGKDGAQGIQGVPGVGTVGATGATGPSGVVNAAAPLAYDATAKALSVALASATNAGVISAADYAKLKNLSIAAIGSATIPALGLGETDVVVTLSPAMTDANYKAFPAVEGANVALGKINARIKSQTATTVTVTLTAPVATVSVGGIVNVMAFVKS